MSFMKKVFLTLVFLGTSVTLHAQDKVVHGYGQAGCGLGAMVFGAQRGPVQILAATLNATGGQTFAMSSGTSNCRPVFGREATDFIDANRVSLANDIARGEGETLATLAALYQCSNSAELASVLKTNYGEIFSTPDVHAGKINEMILHLIKKSSLKSCQTLS